MLNNREKSKLLKDLCDKNGLYPIVPLTSYSKTPYCKWSNEEYQLDDVNVLGSKFSWINKENQEKIGTITGYTLVTGSKSGIMVLDVDNKNGVNGSETLKNLCDDLGFNADELFDTMTVKTPSGGYHLYFKYEEGLKSRAGLFEGLDIKTDGGIIVLPYTAIRKDNKNMTYHLINEGDILHMPESLFNAFKKACNSKAHINSKKVTNNQKRRVSISYEELELTEIKEGKRNDDLISFLGSMIKVPYFRKKERLMEVAFAYTSTYHKPPMDKVELENTVESALTYAFPSYCNNKGRIIISDYVDYKRRKEYIYTRGYCVFIYDKEKGVYKRLEDEQIKNEFLDSCFDSADKTTAKAEEYAKMMQLRTMDKGTEDTKRYINLLNGVYDIEKEELLPHSHHFKTSVQFQGKYDIEKFRKEWDKSILKKVLGQIFSNNFDVIPLVGQMIGLTMSPHAKEVSKVFLLVGEGSNGKSTICNLIKSLHGGVEFISSLGIVDFERQFAPSSLEGKLVNVNPDDNSIRVEQTGNFKKVASGESITVERKGKDQRDIETNVTIVLGFNNIPTSADTTHGFYRRNCIIPFNTTFGNKGDMNVDFEKDVTLEPHIIKNEMDLLVTWAIESLKVLKQGKWKLQETESVKDALEEHKLNTDTGYMFLNEMVKISNDTSLFIASKDIHILYAKWCDMNSFTPMSQQRLTTTLKTHGLKNNYTNKGGEGRNQRGFRSIVAKCIEM